MTRVRAKLNINFKLICVQLIEVIRKLVKKCIKSVENAYVLKSKQKSLSN